MHKVYKTSFIVTKVFPRCRIYGILFTITLFGLFIITPVSAGIEAKCKACHDFGTAHKMGPGLKGIMGMKAGSTDFGNYSKSLKAGGWIWTEENMRVWLDDTKTAIVELSGDEKATTTMPSQKLKGEKLDQVIEFLKGLK